MLASMQDFSINLLGKEILASHSAKDVGVVIDANPSFNEYVKEVVSKCTASLCQINCAKHLFYRSKQINIINSLVFSKIFTVHHFGPVQQRTLLDFVQCKNLQHGLPLGQEISITSHPH